MLLRNVAPARRQRSQQPAAHLTRSDSSHKATQRAGGPLRCRTPTGPRRPAPPSRLNDVAAGPSTGLVSENESRFDVRIRRLDSQGRSKADAETSPHAGADHRRLRRASRKLRQAEIEISRGATAPQAAKKIGVTEQTYYRWRNEYGGLRLDQAKRLKALETENARLKKMVANQHFLAPSTVNTIKLKKCVMVKTLIKPPHFM